MPDLTKSMNLLIAALCLLVVALSCSAIRRPGSGLSERAARKAVGVLIQEIAGNEMKLHSRHVKQDGATPLVEDFSLDTDMDGISDYDEIHKYHTDPNESDSDGDGLSDFLEVYVEKTDPNDPSSFNTLDDQY